MLGLGLGSVRCYGEDKFEISVRVRVSVKLGLGLYIRLGLGFWFGLGLTLPKTSNLTINRNPQNSFFDALRNVFLLVS